MKPTAVVMMLGTLLAAEAATASDPRRTGADACAYDEKAMLALDEDAFDQDLSNGGGGWRKLGNTPGCEHAAADLIAAYRAAHPGSGRILVWHEGQLRALTEDRERAVPLLAAARKPDAEDKAGWNFYVDATVAFLERDKPKLLAARDRLAQVEYSSGPDIPPLKDGYIEFPAEDGQPPMRFRWPPNLDVVDGLIACYDRPYAVAYEMECRTATP